MTGTLLHTIFGSGTLPGPTKIQRCPCNGTPAGPQVWVTTADEIETFGRDHDGEGGTLVYCPAVFASETDSEETVVELRAIVLDFDGKDGLPKEEQARIYTDEPFRKARITDAVVRFNRARKLFGPVTALVISGYGVHAVSVLDVPLGIDDENRAYAKEVLRRLAAGTGADTQSATLSHYYRIPGTTNWKGPVPRACKVVSLRPEARLRFDDAVAAVAKLGGADAGRSNAGPRKRTRGRKPLRTWTLSAGLWLLRERARDGRVTVSFERESREIHRDRLKLDSARSRGTFAKAAANGDKALCAQIEDDLALLAREVEAIPEPVHDPVEARRRYAEDHPIDWAAHGRTCPLCGHHDCFGPLDGDPLRWSCFSSDHDAASGGAGVRGEKVWHGDAADIDVRARKLTPEQLLVEAGYLVPGPCDEDIPYREHPPGLVWLDQTREGIVPRTLTNFTARIVAEIQRNDGQEIVRAFDIEARLRGRTYRFSVPAHELGGMSWPLKHMGAGAIVAAGFGLRDHARAAIQHFSGDPPVRVVFTHTGWTEIDGEHVFLHGRGGLGEGGAEEGVEVDLSGWVSRVLLPAPPEGDELREAVRASLGIADVGPDRITIPVLAMAYRVVVAPIDLGGHVHGKPNVFKTSLVVLAAQHFGASWRQTNLPSWASTGNSIEAMLFFAKDVVLPVDDFVPAGTAHDVMRKHGEAERVFRSQGNLSGRGRMGPDGNLRATRYPRGLALSTGEELPRGQSLGTRIFAIEVREGDIDRAKLTAAQGLGEAGVYAGSMAGFIRWLAGRLPETRDALTKLVEGFRDRARSAGYARVATNVGQLMAGLAIFLKFAVEVGAVTEAEATALKERAWKALNEAAVAHGEDIAGADPVIRYLELLRSVLGSGQAHVADIADGTPPNAGAWGWREREFMTKDGPEKRWEPQGRCIGWLDGGDLYLDPDAAFAAVQAVAGIAGEGLTVRPRTLTKRLHEKGLLASTGAGRKRLLVRVKIEGEMRDGLLHLRAESVYPPAGADDSAGRKEEGWTVGDEEPSTGRPARQAGDRPPVDDLDASTGGTSGPSGNTSQKGVAEPPVSGVDVGDPYPPVKSSKSSTGDANACPETTCGVDDSGGVDDRNVHSEKGKGHPPAAEREDGGGITEVIL